MGDGRSPGIPLVVPPFDPEGLADWFAGGFPEEFCACRSFDPALVAGLVGAGFIPMASGDLLPGTDILLPKLHLERCVLEPSKLRVTRSARRACRDLVLSASSAFDEVLDACLATHGAGWLRPSLLRVFRELFRLGGARGTRLLSFELCDGERLVAGEVGALVGSVYTSWSGFRTGSGTGTAQLVALGRALEAAGVRLWDLGMPLPYKEELGGLVVSREDFLARFRAARSESRAPRFDFLPCGARDLVDRAFTVLQASPAPAPPSTARPQ